MASWSYGVLAIMDGEIVGEDEALRAARRADLTAMAEILAGDPHCTWSENSLAAEFDVEWSTIEILTSDKQWPLTRGLLVYWHVADELQLLYVATHPASLRRGIGTRLMQHLCDQARRLGALSVSLEVRADNEAALRLYQTMGFVEVGRRPGYYQAQSIDAVLMEWRTT